MEPENLDDVTEVDSPSLRVEFRVAPGHTLYVGVAKLEPGDPVRVTDQEQMNTWIEMGAIVLV